MTPDNVEIVGAGPAGLAAALAIAKVGGRATVFERHGTTGHRFHGDFQGLENWTTYGDALDELASLGVDPTFEYVPYRECVFYDPDGREYAYRSSRPIWYLVRRGAVVGTLDESLHRQAIAAGADIRFNTPRETLVDGGIVAHGPHRPDAIAVGYVFDTDRADGAFAAMSDALAPKGYSYLLIAGGRGTIASCMFADFHNEAEYLERTVAFFEEKVGFAMRAPRRFGGFGNVFAERTARKGRLLYVGEAAGFQDALFGFGMRYAMVSGALAARAWSNGRPETYDGLLRQRFGRLFKAGMVNRDLYGRLGDGGYARLMRRGASHSDIRDWLHRYYHGGLWTPLYYPLARRRLATRRRLIAGCREGCSCTWCRCEGHRSSPVAGERDRGSHRATATGT